MVCLLSYRKKAFKMNTSAIAYRNKVSHFLKCSKRTKKVLLSNLDQLLSTYLIDEPNAVDDDIFLAFGPPEQMAKTLYEDVPATEKKKLHRNKALIVSGVVLVALVVLFCISYLTAIHNASPPVYVDEETIIYVTEEED